MTKSVHSTHQFGHAGANQGFGWIWRRRRLRQASVLKIYLVLWRWRRQTSHPNAPRQGADLQYQVTLDFEEAIFGKELNVEIQ